MAFVGKLPNTNYAAALTEKQREYKVLMNDAYYENLANRGEPSKREAWIYKKAADVCAEIVELSGRNSATAKKWSDFGAEAAEKYNEVVMKLRIKEGVPPVSPPPPEPQEQRVGEYIPPERGARAQTPPPKPNGQPSASASAREVKTKSGFVTRNACRDVPAETIETWYKAQPSHDLSDVVGMEDLKARLMEMTDKHLWKLTNEATGEKALSCVLFYGPPGTGKTFFIEGYIAELVKKGYTYIQLQGADIHASHVGVAEKTVQIACKEAIDHAPSVIFIDEFEDVSVDRGDPKAESHEKRLTVSLIEEYNTLMNSDKPIFFLAATNHPEKIDSAWISRFKDMRMVLPLPSEKQRELYFARKLENIRLTEGLSIDYIVDKTDNYSYRDLDALYSEIISKIVNDAKRLYSVKNEDGSINIEESDKPVSEAILGGKTELALSDFTELRRAKPPAPKEDIIQTLRAYEDKAKAVMAEGD